MEISYSKNGLVYNGPNDIQHEDIEKEMEKYFKKHSKKNENDEIMKSNDISDIEIRKKGKRNTSIDAYQKKKEYNKKRNQKLRQAEKTEADTLKNQTIELELIINNLIKRRGDSKSIGILPWKDIATIFQQMKTKSTNEKNSLLQRVQTYKDVAFIMHQWVHSNHHLPVMPDPYKQTWRNSSLVAHDKSRELGFDWISKQLFYNIDSIIAHCGLPSTLETCNDVRVYPLENQTSYHLSKARQRIEFASLEEVIQCLRRQYFEGKTNELDPLDPNMCYFRAQSPYGAKAHHSYSQNILMRQFLEVDRYVVFAHSITEDEKHPVDEIQRNWTNWTVAERLGPNMTIIKQMSVASGLRRNEEFLFFDTDLDENETIDPHQAFKVFERKTQEYHREIFAKEVDGFRTLLAQIRDENGGHNETDL